MRDLSIDDNQDEDANWPYFLYNGPKLGLENKNVFYRTYISSFGSPQPLIYYTRPYFFIYITTCTSLLDYISDFFLKKKNILQSGPYKRTDRH